METIKSILSLIWQDTINVIHLFDENKSTDKNSEIKQFKKDGIIEIENFLSEEECDIIKHDLDSIVSDKLGANLIKVNKGKINIRNENNENIADKGMIDIFHVNEYIKRVNNINIDSIKSLLENTLHQKVHHYRTNAYINRGVLSTRGYHVDNFQPTVYKAFIYLTDVPDKRYGPYSFIKGSHQFSLYTYLNIMRNIFVRKNRSSDISFYNRKKIKTCLGGKGTLILSNQNGIHRGLPQSRGKERVALIFNFMVESRLSYIHKSAKSLIK